MKIKSLFLGSVAAAGLSTGAYAADLNVLTSLDVCDLLGMSGLTISSDTNCLAITGEVKYEFNWGNYETDQDQFGPFVFDGSNYEVDNPGGAAGAELDWSSDVDSWIQFVGAAESDFGTAKAVLKLENEHKTVVIDEATTTAAANGVGVKEAYVSVGDGTVLVAGLRDTSTFNDGDDSPLNFLGLYNSEKVDTGVGVPNTPGLKGHVIQLYHDLGNGVTIKGGLENLQDTTISTAGSVIGTIEYAGDGISAHASFAAGGILDGTVENWASHAGITATMDQFKFVAALAASHNNPANTTTWNALASGSATFDMFTLALSGEWVHQNVAGVTHNEWGIGGSAEAMVTDGITIKAGARYYDPDNSTANDEGYQAALALVAALTETVTATGEVGVHGTGSAAVTPSSTVTYGSLELAWKPGGDFETSGKIKVNSLGAYKTTFKASKKFQ